MILLPRPLPCPLHCPVPDLILVSTPYPRSIPVPFLTSLICILRFSSIIPCRSFSFPITLPFLCPDCSCLPLPFFSILYNAPSPLPQLPVSRPAGPLLVPIHVTFGPLPLWPVFCPSFPVSNPPAYVPFSKRTLRSVPSLCSSFFPTLFPVSCPLPFPCRFSPHPHPSFLFVRSSFPVSCSLLPPISRVPCPSLSSCPVPHHPSIPFTPTLLPS